MISDKFLNNIVLGDCLELLWEIPRDSIDLVVTDPPYGLSFMGKDWDRAVPPVKVWVECVRVLKPGAFAFIMSSPRFDCLTQMGLNLREAGFNVGFSPIYWSYASGFPKAANISRMVDKKLGVKRDIVSGTPKPHKYSGKFDQRSSSERLRDKGSVSSQAKSLDGAYGGFQPKPAVEVIIVAMKPIQKPDREKMSLNFDELNELKNFLNT